jgi:hypothetical protein
MFQAEIVEEVKTHIVFSNLFFFLNRAVFEIKWRNIVELDRPQMAIWRISSSTNTHSEYVKLIAFPL